jgi:AraC-like DNA-binding protein
MHSTRAVNPAIDRFRPKEPLESLLFASDAIGVGTFRCRPDDPLFHDSGPSSTYCFVFPRTPVWIRHADDSAFVADPRTVTYYNAGQVYSRRKLSDDGDRGEWFAIDPDLAAEIVADAAPEAHGCGDRVFGFSHGPCDNETYLLQRQVTEHLRANAAPDALWVEETAIALLSRLVPMAAGRRPPVTAAGTLRQRHLVDDARALVALLATQPLRLGDLAARLSCSIFHLCRTFRRIEGTTIHAYQQDIRLRMALEALPDADGLTDIALDLGFCSHSHFTAAFRRRFGLSPSAYVAGIGRSRLLSSRP